LATLERNSSASARNARATTGRTLLVAATGGHLKQLVTFAPRFELEERPTWVTFPSPQAEVLLEGEPTIFVRHTGQRDFANVARNTEAANKLLTRHRIERVISTGNSIALSFLPLARARGLETHYIESATRPLGPSLTGRVLRSVPGVRLYTQHPACAGPRWTYRGCVFDGFAAGAMADAPPPSLKVALIVGTMTYPFTRLVDRVASILPPNAEVVLWQTGASANGSAGSSFMSPLELLRANAEADVVICHAGVGSVLDSFDTGHCPIIVPRRAEFGEHVDNHQVLLAKSLAERGLAIYREPHELTSEDLELAAVSSVRSLPRAPRYELDVRTPQPARVPLPGR
jgi:UDP-N-acetylglucosamine--N-acetylmuramyl-(pentapeptide) pyrophosphoryl-undecaprenol N-acetylglucosamine transferase